MNRISKNLHAQLLQSAERSAKKHADELLTKKVPVSIRVLKELGLPVSAAATKRLAQAEKNAKPKHTVDVAESVMLVEYVEALRAYGKPAPAKPPTK